MMRQIRALSILWLIFLVLSPLPVAAAPYFFITGDTRPIRGNDYFYEVKLNTNGQTLTAAQTVVNLNATYVEPVMVSTVFSRCSFFAPADPSLGYGNTGTPYFYGGDQVVISCGFSNPGYVTANGSGDIVARFSITPTASASGSTSYTFSDTLFRYIGTTIAPGTSQTFNLTTFESTTSAYMSPTPVTNPTPYRDSLSADDLNFISTGSSTTRTGASVATSAGLNAITSAGSLDNSIPAPPDLTPRPTATPYLFPTAKAQEPDGDVLSIQSLRELLLPGKSSADQTVVLINMISTFTFLIILTVLVWRLITISRMNKVKYSHLKEMMAGELSVLETKLSTDEGQKEYDISSRLEELRKEIEGTK